MVLSALSTSAQARIFLMLIFGTLCAAFVVAPLLAASSHAGGASLLYWSFSNICHQDAARCFQILGTPWAVCQRCSGIYFGLFLATLIPARCYRRVHSSPMVRKWWVLLASLPLVFDGVMSLFGMWAGSSLLRFATGFLFGAMLTTLLVQGIIDLVEHYPRRRRAAPQGGNS